MIKKHSLIKSNYVYARFKNDKWEITDGKSKRYDKFFISKKWFNKNIVPQDNIEDDIEIAPPIIELNDSEKFFDNKGKIIEIEVRGERDINKCYFKVLDISKGFNIPNLRTIIKDKNSSYNINIDYVYFSYNGNARNTCVSRINDGIKTKRKLFLTYGGVLKVLYSSTGKKKFTDWASKTLFTVQLGKQSQKNKLASNLIGINNKSLTELLNSSSSSFSCIYLFFIGFIKDYRKKHNIEEYDDDDLIVKYGRTNDLSRRTREHVRKYGNQIESITFNLIDPNYASEAEALITSFFDSHDNFLDLCISKEPEREMVVIKKSKIKNIKKQYSLIGSMYEGKLSKHAELIKDLINRHEKELQQEIHEKELLIKKNELQQEKHKKELLIEKNKLQQEKHEKELLIEKYENKLLQQEIINLKSKKK